MPNAALSAVHAARLIEASEKGEDWRNAERNDIAAKMIPRAYIISEERMKKTRQLPEVRGSVATDSLAGAIDQLSRI